MDRDEQDRRWWAWYDQYLQSPEWQARRRLVLRRAGGKCEGCRIRRAVQAHHLTYDRVGREMLFDLVAVCAECHNQIHAKERAGTPTVLDWIDCLGSVGETRTAT